MSASIPDTSNLIERFSADGRYRLAIRTVPTRPGCWNVLEVDVFRVAANQRIAQTTRNHPGHGIFTFLSQDGVDYLLISEDYHGGYGLIDLHSGEKVVFTPKRSLLDKHPAFWCWASVVSHDPVAKEMVVEGCYWGAPYDRITFDVSKPMTVPYPELKVEDAPWDEEYDEDEESEESANAANAGTPPG